MRISSADQNHFGRIPQISRPRSAWLRPSKHKGTFDEGELIPFYLDDVIPGDTFRLKASIFARLATPIFPLMDNMYLETFWFFVPNRLVWDNFVRQHGERPDPNSSTDFTTPVINTTGFTPAVMSLWDHFALPMGGSMETAKVDKVSALPFRMYFMIWNEWFRDQDIQNSLTFSKGNGPDLASSYSVQRINKVFDYFTGCRPAPQKGPSVEIPIAGEAPIVFGGQADVWGTTGNIATGSPSALSSPVLTGVNNARQNMGTNTTSVLGPVNVTGTGTSTFGSTGSHVGFATKASSQTFKTGATAPWALDTSTLEGEAQLSEATGPTVNQFREAVTIQQIYELDMRGGTRFIEMIFNHFGVVNPDFRLQRPEFLAHSRNDVNIHPVPQTSQSDETPQGNISAFGTSSARPGFVKTFTEHGYVIGLLAVRADLTYQNGLDKMWSRQTRFDYYYPAFANLGEQAVLREELDVDLTGANNKVVFGYQERWADYRFKRSTITGLFRSSAPQSLDAWHLAQELSAPTLSDTFIREDAPVDRVIAIPSEPHFIFDSIVNNHSARVMPAYSVPGLTRI